MEARLVPGRAATDDADKRLLDANGHVRNTLGVDLPLATMHRMQVRHLGRLPNTHRQQPTAIPMNVAGRLGPEAYPEAYPALKKERN